MRLVKYNAISNWNLAQPLLLPLFEIVGQMSSKFT